MTPEKALLDEIQAYVRAAGLTPTAFGKQAANDPTFVFDLQQGRELRRKTRERVQEFMRKNPPKRGAA